MWAAVKKLKRGADKWRPWNVQNIQDENGKISTTPEENADNFQQCYNNLYDNDGEEGGAADCWYDEMEQGENERDWRAPQMFELDRAVRELKNTAPGLSGITAMMWKALITNSALREIMLETMVECWNEEKVPKEWLQCYMTVTQKKGDVRLPGNYRGMNCDGGNVIEGVHADSKASITGPARRNSSRMCEWVPARAQQNRQHFRRLGNSTDAKAMGAKFIRCTIRRGQNV